jgi:hypothetical protein
MTVPEQLSTPSHTNQKQDLFEKLSPLITLVILLKFQRLRHRKELRSSRVPLRNLFFEWETRWEKGYLPVPYNRSLLQYVDLIIESKAYDALPSMESAYLNKYALSGRNFTLYEHIEDDNVPSNREPAPGIEKLPFRYHPTPVRQTLHSDLSQSIEPDVPPEGFPPHPAILNLLKNEFPSFTWFTDYYCRPNADGNAAFTNFNTATTPMAPIDENRKKHVLTLLKRKFNIKPYRPLHFVDALASRAPYSTSADYFHKKDPHSRSMARYSSPSRYADRPSSKGHFVNTFLYYARQQLHNVKQTSYPFSITDEDDLELLATRLANYFHARPCQLFIRTQISERPQPNVEARLKVRPVYNVPMMFLHIEKMLTLPLLYQLRNSQCCVMHGLETFRGSMQYLDLVALDYNSFFGIDWSLFDQLLPFVIIHIYYEDWLESLLYINGGYMPSKGYKDTTMPSEQMFKRLTNTLWFLHMWYVNMVFLSFDGHAYKRTNAGVPSGLLNTQSLDSFGNLFVMIDALIEFGFSDPEILSILFFIMGDDNIGFTSFPLTRLLFFIEFLEAYALVRYGMILSKSKSLVTSLRERIEVLSYTNNFGMPTRPLGKLLCLIVFPERLPKPGKEWIRAAAAIGGAYAACGMDPTLHKFFNRVYDLFKPATPIPTYEGRKYVNYFLSELIAEEDINVSFDKFPTIEEVRSNVKSYKGFFQEDDHWNYSMFETAPSDPDFTGVTVLEFREQHNLPRMPTQSL